jgi:hypothetical protein
MAMQARGRYGYGMKLPIMILLAATAASPALAQGAIGTVERGSYVCELPGDAASRAGVEQPGENFVIESASRYSSAQGAGTYLRRGNTLTFTSGPRQGESFAVVGAGFVRRMENGQPGRLRCVRTGR